MWNHHARRSTFFLLGTLLFSGLAPAAPIRVLVLTGQNNHAWQETTQSIQRILDENGRFATTVTEHPESMTPEQLAQFDVIVSNWNAWGDAPVKDWSQPARDALLAFVRSGKGFVSVHAGTSSFYDWPEYQELAITSWKLGETGHGKRHRFNVKPIDQTHPITQGVLPFMTHDELWHKAPIQPGATVLATAYSSVDQGGSGDEEEMLVVRPFGDGRAVNLLLGHDATAMETPSFGMLLARSVEWAATGVVTTPARTVSWEHTSDALTLSMNGEVLWTLHFGASASKPFFHPLALPGGPTLTWDAPPDHVWHHGLWFSWKSLNGVNFWEENPSTGRADGITAWEPPEIASADDGSARVKFAVLYELADGTRLIDEERSLVISAPDNAGNYFIDWTSVFKATSGDVKLDRTPILGEPDGQTWGGYAGLSLRFAPMSEPQYFTENGPVEVSENRAHVDAEALSYSGVIERKNCGIAMLQYPGNPLSPVPWYVISNPPNSFYFFSPTVLYRAPRTLTAAAPMTLHYRVYVHSGHWDSKELQKHLAELNVSPKEQ